VVALVAASTVACTSASTPAPAPSVAPPAPSSSAADTVPGPLAWNAHGDALGADVVLGKPVRGSDGIATVPVTLVNHRPAVLTDLVVDGITADGAATDLDDDNTEQIGIGVVQGKSFTYTMHLTKVPASAKEITVTVEVDWTSATQKTVQLTWAGAVA
jgi:hypothetical protein